MDKFCDVVAMLLEENVGAGKRYRNYRQLADFVGTSHTTFTFLTQNRIKNPNPSLLRRLSKALVNDEEYLVKVFARTTLGLKHLAQDMVCESGASYGKSPSSVPSSDASSLDSTDKGVFLVDAEFDSDPAEGLPVDAEKIPVVTGYDNAFAFKMIGDSMSPRYMSGDCVVAAPDAPLMPDRPVLFKAKGQTIKCRLWKTLGSANAFIPLNPAKQVLSYTKNDIVWIYPIIMMWRDEK